jgi:hypothetical protein
MKKHPNNFKLELLEQIFYVVNKYIMNISQYKKPGKLSPSLLRIMEDITFLTQCMLVVILKMEIRKKILE